MDGRRDGADDGRRRHGVAAGDAGRGGAAASGGGGGGAGVGGRQGAPLEQDHDGREGPGDAELRERAEQRPPEVEGQAGHAEGGLRRPTADPGQPGQAAAAPRPRPGPGEHSKTDAGSRGGLQPRTSHAQAIPCRPRSRTGPRLSFRPIPRRFRPRTGPPARPGRFCPLLSAPRAATPAVGINFGLLGVDSLRKSGGLEIHSFHKAASPKFGGGDLPSDCGAAT